MVPPSTRVLVVDDNQTDRLIVQRMCESFGLTDVQVAEDGSIAESKILNAELTKKPFQLIFLDYNMPGMNGMKLLQHIRRSKFTKAAKVIIMTAGAEVELVEAAVVSGANDFIVKPIALAVLKEKLTKLFAGR